MKWPPNKRKPAYRDGEAWQIKMVGEHTIGLERVRDSFYTSLAKHQFLEHWTQEAPKVKPIQEQRWEQHPQDWRMVVDAETHAVVADVRVSGADGGRETSAAMAAAPDMMRALADARRSLMGDMDPGKAVAAIDAALKKAGAL